MADSSGVSAAARQAHTAQANVDQARSDLNLIRSRIRTKLAADPQWASVLSELKSSQAAFSQARHDALARLARDPAYQKLETECANARDTLNSAADSDISNESRVRKATDLLFQDGSQIAQMETKALNSSDNYKDAKTRLDSARAKFQDLDAQVEKAVQDDPQYQQAMQQMTSAQQQLKSARQQLAQAAKAARDQEIAKEKAAAAAAAAQNTGY